jgi:isopentenyl-diphosphate Delta-isomerase
MTDSEEQVVLVNDKDEPIGTMDKLQAHRDGALHRAFSIFLFDEHGKLLLQRRAEGKYHSPGLWTNTCCGHPRPGEHVALAAQRRLLEEMGLEVRLEQRFQFLYHAEFENGMVEHEIDHVLFGPVSGPPVPDPTEVQDWCYTNLQDLDADLRARPERYTAWLHRCWPTVLQHAEAIGIR